MRYRIVKWDDFQHYKDRRPPWIKLHFSLLTSRTWVTLADASRVLAVASMLLASQDDANDGSFDGDPEYVKRVAYLNEEPDFEKLVSVGFLDKIEYAGGCVLADASICLQTIQNAIPETETETETYTDENTSVGQDESKNEAPSVKKKFSFLRAKPEWIPAADWRAIVEHRKCAKSSMTERAHGILVKELEKAIAHGHTIADCIDLMTQGNWRGFRAEWVVNRLGEKKETVINGNRF